MNEQIWTQDIYRVAALSMLRHFGPYGTFEMKGKEWDNWCDAFGYVIRLRNHDTSTPKQRAKAVDVNIRSAMCPTAPWPEGGIWKPKLMGLSAGLEMGWLKPSDLNEATESMLKAA